MSADQPRKLAVLSALIFCLYCCKGVIQSRDEQGASAAAAVTVGTSESGGAVGPPVPSPPDRIFLFIGCLSSPDTASRRPSVRHAWLDAANETEGVVARFVLSSASRESSEMERDDHDVMYVDAPEVYAEILLKVLALFFEAQRLFDPAWILKTDDDSFVAVPALLQTLHILCAEPSCHGERLYVGHVRVDGDVLTNGPWSNAAYLQAVGNKYLPYCYGGGYLLTRRVVQALLLLHRTAGLSLSGSVEDSQVGLLIAGLAVTRIHLPGFHTISATCCYRDLHEMRREGALVPPRHVVRHKWGLDIDPCSGGDHGPHLVLHKLPAPSCMKHLGRMVRGCASWSDDDLRRMHSATMRHV